MKIRYENGKAVIDKEEGQISESIRPLTLAEKQEIALLLKIRQ